jgi:hypothetical protein
MGPFNSQKETSFPGGGGVPVIVEGSGTLETEKRKRRINFEKYSFIETLFYPI